MAAALSRWAVNNKRLLTNNFTILSEPVMLASMQADSPIAQRWDLMRERLDERQRRAFAGAEARVLGRGGVAQVAAATGLARNTIVAGMQELDGSSNEFILLERHSVKKSQRRGCRANA